MHNVTNIDESVKEEAEYNDDEDMKTQAKRPRRRQRRRRQRCLAAKFVAECVIPIWCASVALEPHLTDVDLNALQHMHMENGFSAQAWPNQGRQ